MNLTLDQLTSIHAEIQVALFVNQFTRTLIEQDLALVETEIEDAKIIQLCLTGE